MNRTITTIAATLIVSTFAGAAFAAGKPTGDRSQRAFQRMDRDRDGRVSKTEFIQIRSRAFGRIDRNRDGVLDRAEIKTMMNRVMARRTMRLFDRLDTNRDGKLSRAELPRRAQRRFHLLDTNGDGGVNHEELMAAIKQRLARRGRRKRGLAAADQNLDGRITRAEFETHNQAIFARLDRNRDGALALNEMPRRRWRRQR